MGPSSQGLRAKRKTSSGEQRRPLEESSRVKSVWVLCSRVKSAWVLATAAVWQVKSAWVLATAAVSLNLSLADKQKLYSLCTHA